MVELLFVSPTSKPPLKLFLYVEREKKKYMYLLIVDCLLANIEVYIQIIIVSRPVQYLYNTITLF